MSATTTTRKGSQDTSLPDFTEAPIRDVVYDPGSDAVRSSTVAAVFWAMAVVEIVMAAGGCAALIFSRRATASRYYLE